MAALESAESGSLGEDGAALEITTITTRFVLNVSVNCYLVEGSDGYVLIDTGAPGRRRTIETQLDRAGCRPGNVKLIIVTHGDRDHAGNAAYLRDAFGAPIGMHSDDAGIVEQGDMFWNRTAPNRLAQTLLNRLMGLSGADRFAPDVLLQDGEDLSGYGLEARVLSLPGHSRGSIGVLTAAGDLFCGDLLANVDRPNLWSIIDDHAAARSSVARLRGLPVHTVYPGHGSRFAWTPDAIST